jgi:hypothetical protein
MGAKSNTETHGIRQIYFHFLINKLKHVKIIVYQIKLNGAKYIILVKKIKKCHKALENNRHQPTQNGSSLTGRAKAGTGNRFRVQVRNIYIYIYIYIYV